MTHRSSDSTPRLAALRYRDFRLLWSGQLLSVIGSNMQYIALNWHVYTLLQGQTYTFNLFDNDVELGAEAFGLGMLGLVRIVPIFIFALIGGMMADVHDRRRIIIWTQSAAAFFSALLAVTTLSGADSLAWIYLLTAGVAATSAFENPAQQSLIPNLVPREYLTNAVSLNTIMFYAGTIVGPGLAGLMLDQVDVGVVYAVNAMSFGAFIIALVLMKHRAVPRAAGSGGFDWASLVEGVRFTFNSRIIWSTMLLDFFATFFSSARTMLPIVADSILGAGAGGYGLLATAQPIGAVIAGFVLALRKDIYRQGVVLLISVAVYGLATALFGISTSFVLSYLLFALTGAGDTVSTVIRGTIRQVMTPDRLRGRMTGVNMIFFMGGPQLGELEAGLAAALFGAPFAIVTGGIATVLLTGWIAWRYPRLRRYTSDTMAEALAG